MFVRLGWRSLPGTNALTYYKNSLIKDKIFIILSQGSTNLDLLQNPPNCIYSKIHNIGSSPGSIKLDLLKDLLNLIYSKINQIGSTPRTTKLDLLQDPQNLIWSRIHQIGSTQGSPKFDALQDLKIFCIVFYQFAPRVQPMEPQPKWVMIYYRRNFYAQIILYPKHNGPV